MELLLEHEELREVLLKHWKDAGIPVSESSRLVVRCNHRTNTVRAVIIIIKEKMK